MEQYNSSAYLVNTGWDGNGKRISIKATRAIIDSILDGAIDQAECHSLPIFNLTVPATLPGVDAQVLDPRSSYQTVDEWQVKAEKLAALFIENFVQYTDNEQGRRLVNAGPAL